MAAEPAAAEPAAAEPAAAEPASRVVHVHTILEYVTLVDYSELMVVDFFTTWCGPCKRIAPVVDALSVEFKDVVFVMVDMCESELEDLVVRSGVCAMPTFLVYKRSKRVEYVINPSPDALRALVIKHK